MFMDKATKRAETYYYTKPDAIQFIKECEKENVVVLGIDGFYLTSNTTQPSMDNSIDYSMRPFDKSIYDKAIQFLEEKSDDLYFEIVIVE